MKPHILLGNIYIFILHLGHSRVFCGHPPSLRLLEENKLATSKPKSKVKMKDNHKEEDQKVDQEKEEEEKVEQVVLQTGSFMVKVQELFSIDSEEIEVKLC